MVAQPVHRQGALEPEPAQRYAADPPARIAVPAAPGSDRAAANAGPTAPRQAERRTDGRRRPARSILNPHWSRMAAAFGIGGAVTGLAAMTWPGPIEAALWLGSTLAALCTPLAIRFEQRRPPNRLLSAAVNVAVVGLPMLAFGLMLALWTSRSPSPHWEAVIGIAVIVGALAKIILHRRVPSIMLSFLALWTGVVAVAGSLTAWLVLAAGGLSAVYTTLRQLRDDAEEDERRQERRRAQDRAQEILSDYEQTGQGWFWETDRRGMLVYLSPTIARVLGRRMGELVGGPFSELFEADPAGEENERTLAFHLSARSAFGELALRAATPDEERWWSLSGRPLYDHFGNFVGFRGSGNDLTEKRRSAEHASRLAHYDSLTGLANRLQMSQTLEKILSVSSRSTTPWGIPRATAC
jgi:PAS domain S-box-containing protein